MLTPCHAERPHAALGADSWFRGARPFGVTAACRLDQFVVGRVSVAGPQRYCQEKSKPGRYSNK